MATASYKYRRWLQSTLYRGCRLLLIEQSKLTISVLSLSCVCSALWTLTNSQVHMLANHGVVPPMPDAADINLFYLSNFVILSVHSNMNFIKVSSQCCTYCSMLLIQFVINGCMLIVELVVNFFTLWIESVNNGTYQIPIHTLLVSLVIFRYRFCGPSMLLKSEWGLTSSFSHSIVTDAAHEDLSHSCSWVSVQLVTSSSLSGRLSA